MCFYPIWGFLGGGLPRGLGHNLLIQFFSLGSPLPSSRCLAKGNRILIGYTRIQVIVAWCPSPPPPPGGGGNRQLVTVPPGVEGTVIPGGGGWI